MTFLQTGLRFISVKSSRHRTTFALPTNASTKRGISFDSSSSNKWSNYFQTSSGRSGLPQSFIGRKPIVLITASACSCFVFTRLLFNKAHSDYSEDRDNRIKDLLPTDAKTVQAALEKKSTGELALAVMVYRISSWNWLVSNALSIIEWAEKLHVSFPIYFFVRHSFFRLFCGGEGSNDVIPVMKSLQEAGIGSILDLSIEADESPMMNDDSQWSHLSLSQRRSKVYESTQNRLSSNAILTLESIGMAGALPGSFCAVKVTSLASTLLLLNVSEAEKQWKQIVFQVTDGGTLTWNQERFERCLSMLPGAKGLDQEQIQSLYTQVSGQDGLSPWNQMRMVVNVFSPTTGTLFCATDEGDSIAPQVGKVNGNGSNNPSDPIPIDTTLVTPSELKELRSVMDRLDFLCQKAKDQGVKLMIDAEQSYFQPAIDRITLELQAKYNKLERNSPKALMVGVKCDDKQEYSQEPVVLTTYQMYLKKSFDRLQDDFEVAKQNQFCLGVKMVRGAYLVSERKRAQTMGYPDIIQDSLEETHANYNRGLDFVLGSISQHYKSQDGGYFPCYLVVASHNRYSIGKTIQTLEEEGIDPEKVPVAFGQLLGMYDTVSYHLSSKGYHIFKYVPYGPLKEVIPYLLRRAQENSSVFDSNNAEGQLIWNELKRRLVPFS